jgi:hypothetical protein
MKRQAHAKRRDSNELEIVRALQAVGATVERLDFVDLIVCFRGGLFLIEVKTATGKLTATQKEKFPNWPIHIVRDTGAALLAIGAITA